MIPNRFAPQNAGARQDQSVLGADYQMLTLHTGPSEFLIYTDFSPETPMGVMHTNHVVQALTLDAPSINRSGGGGQPIIGVGQQIKTALSGPVQTTSSATLQGLDRASVASLCGINMMGRKKGTSLNFGGVYSNGFDISLTNFDAKGNIVQTTVLLDIDVTVTNPAAAADSTYTLSISSPHPPIVMPYCLYRRESWPGEDYKGGNWFGIGERNALTSTRVAIGIGSSNSANVPKSGTTTSTATQTTEVRPMRIYMEDTQNVATQYFTKIRGQQGDLTMYGVAGYNATTGVLTLNAAGAQNIRGFLDVGYFVRAGAPIIESGMPVVRDGVYLWASDGSSFAGTFVVAQADGYAETPGEGEIVAIALPTVPFIEPLGPVYLQTQVAMSWATLQSL